MNITVFRFTMTRFPEEESQVNKKYSIKFESHLWPCPMLSLVNLNKFEMREKAKLKIE